MKLEDTQNLDEMMFSLGYVTGGLAEAKVRDYIRNSVESNPRTEFYLTKLHGYLRDILAKEEAN